MKNRPLQSSTAFIPYSTQKLRFARSKPHRCSPPLTFGAVAIAAGIIGNARVLAVLATLHMAAERRGATNLDCRHDASLGKVYVTRVGVAPRLAMAAEDICHL